MLASNFFKSYSIWLLFSIAVVTISVLLEGTVNLTVVKYLLLSGMIISISTILFVTITLFRYLINIMVFSRHYSFSWVRTLSDAIYFLLSVFLLKFEKLFTVNENSEVILSLILVTIPLAYFITIVLTAKETLKKSTKSTLIAWTAISIVMNYLLLLLPMLSAALGIYLYTKILS